MFMDMCWPKKDNRKQLRIQDTENKEIFASIGIIYY